MRISDLFKPDIMNSDTNKIQTQESGQRTPMDQQIRALTPGQTLQGEVISKNGADVQIKVADNFVLNARMDQNMNIEAGRNMTFEVKNNGSTLTLSPLFTNTASDMNIMKALDMASLPVNETSLEMTRQMMSAGMSIDKNSLQQVFRELNQFPQAHTLDIVDLHRFGMPVNQSNVNQMISYHNFTHQIINGMTNILDELPNTFSSMVSAGNVDEAARLYQSLVELTEPTADLSVDQAGLSEAVEMASGNTQKTMDIPLDKQVSGQDDGNLTAEGRNTDGKVVDLSNPDIPMVTKNAVEVHGEPNGGKTVIADMPVAENPAGNAEVVEKESAADRLLSLLQQAGQIQENGDSAISAGIQSIGSSISAEKMGEIAEKLLQDPPNAFREIAAAGLDADKIRNLLKPLTEKLIGQWTISPEDVEKAEKIEELYKKLNHQLKGMAAALENAGQNHSAGYKAIGNMSQNLDFMHQVNQMYAYVQLPLKLQQGNAHGDLYVYTNKRNLAMKDGNISALLHLDMEHLGPVDVYVAMQNSTKVSTQFYVQDDDMLDFLEEHMDLLTARLQKRGYDCSCRMRLREEAPETKGGIDTLLDREGRVPLVEYAFDVRT